MPNAEELQLGKGLDVGTAFCACCYRTEDGKEKYRFQRDCFLDIEAGDEAKNMLVRSNANFIESQDGSTIYVIGEDAITFANILSGARGVSKERKTLLRRPMSSGVLNPDEPELAFQIMKEILSNLLQEPRGEGEVVAYSVPAKPVDADFNIMYHQRMIENIVKGLGYVPKAINEGLAVVYSENPQIETEDGETIPFSGIGMSCLCPGTKIYTKRGILPIEDVVEGDMVITHMGRWRPVNKVLVKQFDGMRTNLQIQGYSNNTDEYGFVDNHEIYVKRNNEWMWVGCEDVEKGDIVGEPIVEYKRGQSIHAINLCERTTSSNIWDKKRIEASADVYRFLGYFLGGGSICERDEGIQIDFPSSEKKYVEDLQKILSKNSYKNSTVVDKNGDGSVLRVKYYSKGLASWVKNHCYDENNIKIFPWELDSMKYSDCVNLLAGLIRVDGNISTDIAQFYSTSTNLIMIAKQLSSRIGLPASISHGSPRSHLSSKIGQVNGCKEEWQISLGGEKYQTSIRDQLLNLNCDNSMISDGIFVEDGFCCGRIQNIETEEYSGIVYDLQVEEDHSFSGPFLTIHNCGGGMVNVCFAYKGYPLVEFSIADAYAMGEGSGGDWIDAQVAKTRSDLSTSKVTKLKEKYADFTKNPVDLAAEISTNPRDLQKNTEMLIALDIYYRKLIEYVLVTLGREFAKQGESVDDPIEIVVAGGTSKPQGFENLVLEEVQKLNLPFEIKGVRKSEKPMHSVSNGCLVAALS